LVVVEYGFRQAKPSDVRFKGLVRRSKEMKLYISIRNGSFMKIKRKKIKKGSNNTI